MTDLLVDFLLLVAMSGAAVIFGPIYSVVRHLVHAGVQ